MVVGGTTNQPAASRAAAKNNSGTGLTADNFMQLFTSQIANQNPLDPMQSADFLNQFAQITSVQTLDELKTTMGDLKASNGAVFSMQQLTAAQGMIDKSVTYNNASGVPEQGVVKGLRVNGATTQLVLASGTVIDIAAVKAVGGAPAAAAPAASTTPAPTAPAAAI